MILSNVEIQKAIDTKQLIIDPEPTPRVQQPGMECPYGTHSVDLRLFKEISIPQGGAFCYDLTESKDLASFFARNSTKKIRSADQPYRLAPQKFILARTLESVGLPIGDHGCLAARIEGKSSRARCGLLVHFTAPTVHPGWNGPLTLEMINLGPVDFLLYPEMSIAQLIVEQVLGVPNENPSQFQNQRTPEGLR
jgi:dCTP deaminase